MINGMDEMGDVKDPEILRYLDLFVQRATLVHSIRDAQSAADVIKSVNGGEIPSSLRSVKSLLNENGLAAEDDGVNIYFEYDRDHNSYNRLGVIVVGGFENNAADIRCDGDDRILALHLGKLPMMARGVLFCMIGALTVVPRYWL